MNGERFETGNGRRNSPANPDGRRLDEQRRDLRRLDVDMPAARLAALGQIFDGSLHPPEKTREVNNHVHSSYSFSPYNPSQIAYMAWQSGLQAVGIMDHDSYAGAAEFRDACRILGVAATCGVELRVSAGGSFLAERRINNPDSVGIFYMAIHGIAGKNSGALGDFLQPINRARNERNRKQVAALNRLCRGFFPRELSGSLHLDFQHDVYEYSQAAVGGSITERHIIAALSRKLMAIFPERKKLRDMLGLRMPISPRLSDYLSDQKNPHYLYDLLGLLKSQLLPEFFIQPGGDECVPALAAVDFARSIDAIPAYAYLGDVGDSPTGDKKAEKYEDDFLDELFVQLTDWGFRALTFMPPRNSREQLSRVMKLCREHGLMQISGVDINSSRQSFHCPEVLDATFAHLNESTWALIAHERLVNEDNAVGFFSAGTMERAPSLADRLALFAGIGRGNVGLLEAGK